MGTWRLDIERIYIQVHGENHNISPGGDVTKVTKEIIPACGIDSEAAPLLDIILLPPVSRESSDISAIVGQRWWAQAESGLGYAFEPTRLRDRLEYRPSRIRPGKPSIII